MTSFGETTHVFTVRIWFEPREIEGAVPVLRGVIEHVPTGVRRYFENLDAIPAFIEFHMSKAKLNGGNGRAQNQTDDKVD